MFSKKKRNFNHNRKGVSIPINIGHASTTHVGLVRGLNEDNYLAIMDGRGALFAVADGMGGHSCGEVASAIAVDGMKRMLVGRQRPTPRRMIEGFAAARTQLQAYERRNPNSAGLGTTLTTVWMDRVRIGTAMRALIGHIGDSRCYQITGAAAVQLTWDNTQAEYNIWNGRTPGPTHILKRCLMANYSSEPDLIRAVLRPGDTLLLCSDGLSDLIDLEHGTSSEELAIRSEIAKAKTRNDLQLICDKLVALANARGGHDNITVVIVKYFSITK